MWNQAVQREDGMLNEVRTWHMVTGINMCVFLWISLGYNYGHMHLMMMMIMNLMTLYFCFIYVLRHFCQCVYVIVLLGGTWVLLSKWNRKLSKNYKGFLKVLLLVSMKKCQFFFFNFCSELCNLMMSTGGYLINTSVNTVILYMPFKHHRIIDQFYLVCCWDYSVGEGGGKGEVKEKGRRKSLCLLSSITCRLKDEWE